MKQGKEDFEFIKKGGKEGKRNYIFKTDRITTWTFFFVAVVLVALVLAIIYIYNFL